MALKYLIDSKEDFELLIDYINSEDIFAYDTETNGKFSRFEVQLVGISFGFDDFACYIPLTHTEGKQLDISYVLERLKPIFEDPSKRYVAHHAKFDEMVLGVYSIDARGSGDDTYVMAWLLSETRGSKGLKALTERYLGIKMETYEDVISKGPKKRNIDRDYNFAKVRLEDALSYAADDAYYTLELYHLFHKHLVAQKLLAAYENIERPLVRVVKDIEKTGIAIDREYLEYADKTLPKIADDVEAAIYEEAGEVFKIDSAKQLGHILFDKLQIGKNVPRTPSGNYSTDKKTLANYASKHEIVDNVLRRKKVKKTHSTFVEGLKVFIEKDGRVHPSFNPQGTVTGRFAGNSPNLQQIEGDEVESVKVRNFFVPSKGCAFVVSDYSQIELRILAHLSKDANMIYAFTGGGNDFHEETARKMLQLQGKPLELSEEVPHRARFNAKALNFGIPYGRGEVSVAEQLGVPIRCKEGTFCQNCGRCFIRSWFAAFPDVLKFKEATIGKARQRGFIRTLAGRKRRLLPEIRSNDWRLRGGAERQAFNTIIQGSAADIIKLAMVELASPLLELDSRMIIQIHDELVVESPLEQCDNVAIVLKNIMENPLKGRNPLSIPLITEPKIVEKWGDAK